MQTTNSPIRRRIAAAVLGAALLTAASACTDDDAATNDQTEAIATEAIAAEAVSVGVGTDDVALFDADVVHDIEIEFDDDAYAEMIATFEATGEKDWIEATVTIDGTTIEQVGVRLKGNSSLFGLTSETADDPADLPWLIRFDEYVDGQTYQGYGDLVIRSNSTETSMNEAVALELLGATGLATEDAIAAAFTVNGGETELRLAVEHPDEVWVADNFDAESSALYKADSEGDYSYRGDDPDAYEDVFDQKAGEDDLEPLIEFLDFINNSDDATFEAELADRLDIESFATYLAFQDLVDNFDDIDGPGKNSYLFWDGDTETFTVVNWDLNLAFGTANVGGGPGGVAGGPPAGAGRGAAPAGALDDVPAGVPGGSNVLVERFLEVEEFADLYAAATTELTATLYADGTAATIVQDWVDLLTEQAADLVDPETVAADAEAILESIASS